MVPFEMNDHTLRKRIAQLVVESSRMLLSKHAKQQMRRRRISPIQVLDTLRRGRVVEAAHRNIRGNWQCTLQHRTGGDEIKVAAAVWIDDANGEWVVVITAMN